MCKWGTDKSTLVPIRAKSKAWYSGAYDWELKAIDKCIAPFVNMLNCCGVYTANCCCGHEKDRGMIILQDGKVIYLPRYKEKDNSIAVYITRLVIVAFHILIIKTLVFKHILPVYSALDNDSWFYRVYRNDDAWNSNCPQSGQFRHITDLKSKNKS